MYKAVIFDCDGTLVDSEPLTTKLIVKMMMEHGLDLDFKKALGAFIGTNLDNILNFLESRVGKIDRAAFERDFRARCVGLFQEELQPIEGVQALIESLRVPFCVASNGPKEKMNITLPTTGLDQYFTADRIFSAYDINKWKPEPELFWHACQRMDVDPSEAVIIEDTISGIQGAINAGIDVIAYNAKGESHLYVEGVPNYRHMRDIQQHLQQVSVGA